MFKEISIIGLGFMGASVAGAVKAANPEIKIKGYDIKRKNIDYCLSVKIIDGEVDFESRKYAGDDSLIIMCAHPSAIISFLENQAVFFECAGAVTDVGSVKRAITENAKAKNIKNFVGSHPVSGSDKSGPENADFTLFNGKNCIVVREDEDLNDNVRSRLIEKIAEFWKSLKMRVVFSTAEIHDNIAAYTSHLPHLIAFLLSGTTLAHVLKEKENFAKTVTSCFIGSGFKDSTRIASSTPELWTDIFLMNSANLISSLEDFMLSANILKGFLENGDKESLAGAIRKIADERKEVGI